ncbi:DUF4136 domain-containing protein [Bordetella trematum]|nr:DUF4136 domain-containing protein [Bordetella trematum]
MMVFTEKAMQTTGRALGVLALAAALGGCASGPEIRSDYDHQVNFAEYHSFGFMDPLGTDKAAGYTNLATERLKAATRFQMESRGYVYKAEQPDLLVNFNGRLRQRTEVVPVAPAPYYGYYGYRSGFYGGWPGYGWTEDVYTYTEGTLNIDLVDRRRRQLVWEGVATGQVNDVQAVQSTATIDKVVADLFTRYPFRAGEGVPLKPKQ